MTLRLSTRRRRTASFLFEVLTQRPAARRMAELADRLGFDLAHALARHIEDTADFLERPRVPGPDAEAQADDLSLALA